MISLEQEIWIIFAMQSPSEEMVKLGTKLIKEWKVKNKWVEDKTPAIKT